MSDNRLNYIIAIFFACALLVGPDAILAQTPVTAEVDRTAIGLNEQVTLSVTVSGDLLNIPTPDLSRLQLNKVEKSLRSCEQASRTSWLLSRP